MLRTFLIDLRRGDDYHFAHALASILDSLGYRVRLASGFYASPDAFDVRLGNTPVYASDTHTWVEVRLRSGAWHPVEATPGHQLLSPSQTLGDSLAAIAAVAWAWANANELLVGVTLVVILAAFVWRRWILDALDYLIWRVAQGGSNRQMIDRTVRLLERVWSRRHPPRPASQTVAHWLRRLNDPSLTRLASLHDWATFGPQSPAPVQDVSQVCADSVRWLYQHRRPARVGSQPKVTS